MKTKKRNVIPKKKAIKKPKFIKFFAIWLAIFLAISMAASYFVIGVCRQNSKTKAISKWNSYTQELTKLVNDYCAADEDVREIYYKRLREFVIRYGEEMNEYCGIYIDNEKILEAPCGALDAVSITYDSDDYESDGRTEVYYLEDRSYLDPVTKNGKYDFDKYANQNEVYAAENETLVKIARFLGLKPKALCHGYSTIYVNEKTHTFLPGEVNIFYDHYNEDFEYDEEDAKDTFFEKIDCTPKDTKGYKLIDLSECDAMQYDGYMNPALTDINNAESITNDSSEDINFDDTASVMNWEILTVSAEDFSNKACFKALPLTTALILIVACLVALLLAITVSTIIYSSKKTVWEIFEYRKKTTAAMAHDLKTPLAAMSAYAENLEYDTDPEKRAYYSSKVRENVSFMNKTIEGILMFTKSETGTAKSVARDIDVHALIEAEYNAVAELFEKKNIKVEIKGEGHVKSNKELIDQAVRNLVGNATKYARPDTTVNIVIDNKGFTMTNLTDQKIKNVKDLKKPFVKGEESRDAEGGAGLGLSIVENCLLSAGHSLDIEFEDETFEATVRW
ncbi:MAG: HAMP domain-containing histidine kinase [Clostridiales bacterium]|nr:HAMP domain-containing histidine kinase [Clostridiales bacterium]